jgi:hypothetical protein
MNRSPLIHAVHVAEFALCGALRSATAPATLDPSKVTCPACLAALAALESESVDCAA